MYKFGKGGQFGDDLKRLDLQVEDKTYHVLVANSEEEKETGLMGVTSMDNDEGMLFDYSDDPLQEAVFWMKNTEIPLDIIFINSDGIVISVKQGEPNSEEKIIENSEPIACVLEVNQNSLIEEGDRTDLFEEIEDKEYSNLKVNKLYIYGPDGQVQGEIDSGCRIFSRKNTKTLISMAKRAYVSKKDSDYKRLGRKVFEYIKQQDSREPEYVSTPDSK